MTAIALSSYQPYCGGDLPCAVFQPTLKVLPSGNSAQYEWLAQTLAKVRARPPATPRLRARSLRRLYILWAVHTLVHDTHLNFSASVITGVPCCAQQLKPD